jgi:hypothetical protein
VGKTGAPRWIILRAAVRLGSPRLVLTLHK